MRKIDMGGALALAVAFGLGGAHVGAAAPRAVAGVLDLSSRDLEADGPVRLDGEWGFYWMHLVSPGDHTTLADPPAFAVVPGTWPGSRAFATYHLRVLLPPGSHRLGLRLLTVATAYRLYADGRLVASAGRVAEDAASAEPGYDPVIVELASRGEGALDLVLQASNFHYAKGGAWEPIWLGTPEAVLGLRRQNTAITLFLVGSFVIIGLYHLFMWLARRADPSPLYFAVICFAVTVRILTVDEMYLVTLAPGFPWALHVKLEYVSMLVIAAFLGPFLRALFPAEMPAPVVKLMTSLAVAMAIVVLLTPPVFFSRGLPLLQLYLVAGTVIAPAATARAVLHRRQGAGLFLVGLLTLTAAGIHDTLLSIFRDLPTMQFLGGSIYVLPLALFVCVLSQAVVLALRFAGAYSQLEGTTAQLEETHATLDGYAHELERRVADRTAELERANQQLARLASIDGLTLVGNRRFFDEALGRLWAEHERRRTPLSIAMCDVDHFKAYNDTYGHVRGDETLRAVATALVDAASRPGDTVARYGGEELAVLLPDTDAAGAREVGERIRRGVAALALAHDSSDAADVVTVSVGVATLVPTRDARPEQLVEQADAALYRAKQQGRNRTVAAPPPTS